ncbi:protein FAR1-RELATED SEQUENCE 11 [Artemisia annua]|uniref:Protein FAR1-RELATED SEQUENCE 11 n=1 Tax=Artemisia annua TaxID=35608 RepID=A0A2U1M459_ARTAN|nr:protein FAR1-RELATED SEQUENCE 11 [Artemisia annua]
MQEVFDKPFVGQYLLSAEEAFAFFQNFAKKNGFWIRYGRFENKNGEKRRLDFFCHRQGKPNAKVVDYSKVQTNRTSSKCGCKVYMRITLKRENENFPEEWQVSLLNLEHNHEMLSMDEVQFLPSYRTITTEDEKRILLLKEGGLSIRKIMRVMELEKNVVDNYLFLVRTFVIFSPKFTKKYGDMVAFDTTYKVNSYNMPFGMFVGIDNYGRTILFGCALLCNETTKTFKWLMEKFVLLMKKAPNTILTDQDPWMTEAIAKEMPSTKHVDIAIEDIQQRQIHDSMLEKYKGSPLISQSSLDEQGHHFLTQFAFKKFQEEFGRAIQYTVKEKTSTTFFVKHHKVIQYNNHEVDWDDPVEVISFVQRPPKSKPKGRPKQRMKGGIELAKNTRRCNLCKSVGHNISTCPEKDKLFGKSDSFSRHAAKKKKVMLENEDLNPIFSLKY